MLFDDGPATYIDLHCYLHDMPDCKNWIKFSAYSAHSQRFLPQKKHCGTVVCTCTASLSLLQLRIVASGDYLVLVLISCCDRCSNLCTCSRCNDRSSDYKVQIQIMMVNFHKWLHFLAQLSHGVQFPWLIVQCIPPGSLRPCAQRVSVVTLEFKALKMSPISYMCV